MCTPCPEGTYNDESDDPSISCKINFNRIKKITKLSIINQFELAILIFIHKLYLSNIYI